MPAFFVSRWCPLLATRPSGGLLCRSYTQDLPGGRIDPLC